MVTEDILHKNELSFTTSYYIRKVETVLSNKALLTT